MSGCPQKQTFSCGTTSVALGKKRTSHMWPQLKAGPPELDEFKLRHYQRPRSVLINWHGSVSRISWRSFDANGLARRNGSANPMWPEAPIRIISQIGKFGNGEKENGAENDTSDDRHDVSAIRGQPRPSHLPVPCLHGATR